MKLKDALKNSGKQPDGPVMKLLMDLIDQHGQYQMDNAEKSQQKKSDSFHERNKRQILERRKQENFNKVFPYR